MSLCGNHALATAPSNVLDLGNEHRQVDPRTTRTRSVTITDDLAQPLVRADNRVLTVPLPPQFRPLHRPEDSQETSECRWTLLHL